MRKHKLVIKLARILGLFVPPIFSKLYNIPNKWRKSKLPKLPTEYANLPRAQHALFKLITDYNFNTVLDVGSGAGEHAVILKKHGKNVTALDFGTSSYAEASKDNYHDISRVNVNFNTYEPETKFDCVWASHVLEHQPDAGVFIKKCMDLTKDDGIICITVPPLQDLIVGGHLTLWNAGLLLYQMVFNGLDCRDASICTHGYNISVIVKKRLRKDINLDYDNGDIKALKAFFPAFVEEPFDGKIESWNW